MLFDEVVAVLARRATVADVQQAVRAAFGRGASAWVAEHAGIAPRTARRWLSTSPPKRRLDSILALASDLPDAVLAAQVLRRCEGRLDVGTVDVTYDDIPQGSRTIGEVRINTEYIVEALENGDLDFAEGHLSHQILAAYSPGLEDVLEISSYQEGIDPLFS